MLNLAKYDRATVNTFLTFFFLPTALLFVPLLGILLASAGPAMAQNLDSFSSGVDFSPLADKVISIAVAVLTGLALFLSRGVSSWIASKTHMQNTAAETQIAANINAILFKAIGYAESWAKRQVADPSSQIKNVQIDNFFVEQAVRYAVKSMPGYMEYFKLTPERVEEMIRSRLNDVMGNPEEDTAVIPHAMLSR